MFAKRKLEANPQIWQGLHLRNRRWYCAVIVMLAVIIGLVCAMMMYGHTIYSPVTIFRVLAGEQVGNANFTIIELRLPRMLSALFSGLAFGMAGYIFQTVLRNSLASPDIIGVTSSTSAAAVFCISMLGMKGVEVPVIAVATGIIVSLAIYFLSSKGGFSQTRMILIGIGMQAIVRAFTSYVLTKTAQHDVANTMRWMSGSLNNANMSDSFQLIITVLIGGMIFLGCSSRLRMIEMGNDYAQTLGSNPKTLYPFAIGASVLMVAFSTATVGPIASISFLAGPLAIRIAGRSRSGIFPAGLMGSILVMAGDLIGQYALPARYPVGVITGLLGAPYLIFLLIRMNKRGETH